MKAILKRKIIVPLQAFLTQGITPKKLALTVALGFTIAIFPVIGSTTLICAVVALVFKLNMPAIQLINYSAYPLQFVFFLPFIRLGELIFNALPIPFSINEIIALFQTDFYAAVLSLWRATMYAVTAWTIICPGIALILYFVLVPLFTRLLKKSKKAAT